MPPSLIRSAVLQGIKATPVDIEVDVLAGLPSYTIVGLGDTAIKESKERVTSALTNSGFTPPRRKTIVSLAPASLKKVGSMYDVPIALGFLLASRQIEVSAKEITDSWFLGELGLDGAIRPIQGLLPILLAAEQLKIRRLFIPPHNIAEASAAADVINIYPIGSLTELVQHLSHQNNKSVQKLEYHQTGHQAHKSSLDISDIQGQDHAKRALLIAAASGHNVLLIGPPGTGKTLLAKALAGILPPLTKPESFIVTSLYSVAGQLKPGQGLITARPFRAPHHGASSVALVGGGAHPKPGEVSLAHGGVLFLDELPEFSRQVLDQLRQPIEDGYVTISRAAESIQYPANSQLIGAMNPCKCGYLGSQRKECQCPPGDIVRYQRRVSGPLLDRFDLHVLINDIPAQQLLAAKSGGPTSNDYQRQAQAARAFAISRQQKTNSQLNAREVQQYCSVDDITTRLMYQAEQKFHLSSRGIHRLLKVSRTIADLEPSRVIKASHLAEALQYREQLQHALPEFI